MRKFAIICCSLLLLAATSLLADDWNKKTTVTFSQPVEIPGMVLPAGTYVFKLLNSVSDRHVVLVYNEAEDHLYKMFLAINNYRLTPTGDPVLKFSEPRAKDAPQPLRAWFWPGDTWGQEFVYPKAKAVELAAATQTPVLSTEAAPAEKPEELIAASVAPVAPEEVAPIPEERVEIAQATPPPAPEPAAAAPEAAPAQELPKTASPMPLIGLLGVASLALGGLLKWSRKPAGYR